MCRRPDLALWYSPHYYKLIRQRHRHWSHSLRSERLTMGIATMVALWDVVGMATTVAVILASLLLALLITRAGLVALVYNWRTLLPVQPW